MFLVLRNPTGLPWLQLLNPSRFRVTKMLEGAQKNQPVTSVKYILRIRSAPDVRTLTLFTCKPSGVVWPL